MPRRTPLLYSNYNNTMRDLTATGHPETDGEHLESRPVAEHTSLGHLMVDGREGAQAEQAAMRQQARAGQAAGHEARRLAADHPSSNSERQANVHTEVGYQPETAPDPEKLYAVYYISTALRTLVGQVRIRSIADPTPEATVAPYLSEPGSIRMESLQSIKSEGENELAA